MPPRARSQINRLYRQRNWDHDRADDRERSEDIDIGEKIDLLLQRLPDPRQRLTGGIGRIRSLCLKKMRHGIQRLLIAEIRWRDVLDKPALMELLALGQHGLRQCHAAAWAWSSWAFA